MNIREFVPKPVKGIYRFSRSLPGYVRKQILLRNLRGDNVECPACGWRGLRFVDDVWHEGAICPKCGSDTRHRLLLSALMRLPELSLETLVRNKDVLHFAPEPQIGTRLHPHARRYVTADLQSWKADFNLDISDMPSVGSESFHLVIACDVLEHVRHDGNALLEIHRILKKDGAAILTVPQKDHAAVTYEDLSITDPQEREKAFGQWDHLRIYGTDFVQKVKSVGFKVSVIDENSFDDKIVSRFVLKPPKLSRHPLATNYRKVFFCRK